MEPPAPAHQLSFIGPGCISISNQPHDLSTPNVISSVQFPQNLEKPGNLSDTRFDKCSGPGNSTISTLNMREEEESSFLWFPLLLSDLLESLGLESGVQNKWGPLASLPCTFDLRYAKSIFLVEAVNLIRVYLVENCTNSDSTCNL